MGDLHLNLKKKAIIYHNFAPQKYIFVWFRTCERTVVWRCKFLVKDYPSDINIIFVGEMKEFPCLYQTNLFK
jgi:hypothetical protein